MRLLSDMLGRAGMITFTRYVVQFGVAYIAAYKATGHYRLVGDIDNAMRFRDKDEARKAAAHWCRVNGMITEHRLIQVPRD